MFRSLLLQNDLFTASLSEAKVPFSYRCFSPPIVDFSLVCRMNFRANKYSFFEFYREQCRKFIMQITFRERS